MIKKLFLMCILNALSCVVAADQLEVYKGTWWQLNTLQEAIYHEARGEPRMGQIVVGQVILNRMSHPKFPDTIKDVVYQNKQFSYTERKSLKMTEQRARIKSFIISIALLSNVYYNDKYKDSLFYHACAGKHKVKPRWDWKKLQFDGQIGAHCFYSLRRDR